MGIVREYIKRHGDEFAGESLVYTAQTLAPVDEETVLCACRAANRRGCKSLFIFSSASVSQPARDIAAERCIYIGRHARSLHRNAGR